MPNGGFVIITSKPFSANLTISLDHVSLSNESKQEIPERPSPNSAIYVLQIFTRSSSLSIPYIEFENGVELFCFLYLFKKLSYVRARKVPEPHAGSRINSFGDGFKNSTTVFAADRGVKNCPFSPRTAGPMNV